MTELKEILQEQLGIGLDKSRVLIVGLGKTGYSVAKFLSKNNIEFAIVDSRNTPPFYQQLVDEMPDIPLFLGAFAEQVFSVSTHLIISPGVALIESEIASIFQLKTSEKHKLLLFSLVRFIVPVVFVYLITWLIFWKIIPWVTRGFKQEKK